MDTREFQGLELAARAKITWNRNHWLVPSLAHKGSYRVSERADFCTCDDFELRGLPCKHIFAVRHVQAREKGTPVPMPADEQQLDAIKPKKPTYKQAWPAYNAA